MASLPSGIIMDRRYLDHDPGPGHPESPRRLEVIYDMLEKEPRGNIQMVEPREAFPEELGWNHTASYIERIRKTSGRPPFRLDPDTSTSAGSWLAATLAAGGLFSLLEAIFAGSVGNGFALVRPPGHHAERDHAMGFCLFNNVALGAYLALNRLGCSRVMIIDWDLHHGNGTQHSFYHDPRVLYCSTHQYPYYPGSGGMEETGASKGEGFTVNVPLGPGAGDMDFAAVFSQVFIPIGAAFKPDVIIVSAGFDIFRGDPLGSMMVSDRGFGLLAALLKGLAEKTCGGKIAFCLEGGYDLKGLAGGVASVLDALRGQGELDPSIVGSSSPAVAQRIEEVRAVHARYWPI